MRIILWAAIVIILINIFIINSIYCMDFNKVMTERAKKQMEEWSSESRSEEEWRKIYIWSKLYYGIPEKEFLNLFSRAESSDDSERPYIIEKIENKYIGGLAGKSFRFRVTFVDGYLVKYEEMGHGQNPFGYSDCTALIGKQ